MTWSELQVTSHFSFLRGASSPEELFATAAFVGMKAMAVTDRNSVAGVVRALVAAETTGVRLITGCRLDLVDGASVLVWPEDRPAWSRLTRLLTLGKSRANAQKGEKGKCFLHWEDVAAHAEGLIGALVPGMADTGDPLSLRWMADAFGTRGHVCLTHHRRPGDAMRLHQLRLAARGFGLTPLATGDVLYATPDRQMLQDVVTAIREKCTIDALGFRRERNADRHVKSPAEMARRFRDYPEALRASEAIAERCTFSLRELSALYRYPDEIVMTRRTPHEALEKLARDALHAKFPEGPPPEYSTLLERELKLVGELGYAPYFLTVMAIVEFARAQDILCQGRGSAANSLICYLLGVTSIDPVVHELLFERFVSGERQEPPDIDVDFEHERREEVIQWIYETYGQRHAALTAVVSRFRTRGAVREVGKVLGLPEDVTSALASQVWGWSEEGVPDEHVEALRLDPNDPRLALTLQLSRELIGTPRHLSQHPGGFVLAQHHLDEIVPIEPAAMVDRRVVEWEKDDIETLGLMKVDILGLGMLGCMRRAFDLLDQHKGLRLTLHSDELQTDDKTTFAMIQKADTLGTFQIESRAQMSMLPRLKPKEFYDLVIQVAIVRPGPIQGDMVHPYLRRREGKEKPEFPKPELQAVLHRTFGVPLFQEQAMKVAIVGAGFTPAEADALRRAMATFKSTGGVTHFRDKMINGMLANGYTQDFAERTFKQIEGFGSYGFPESHAASFAKIAYASSWMKCHHPDIFCAALLNAQPMGFYAPAQIVRDAREHGVEVRPVCINHSEWDTIVLAEAPSACRPPARFAGTGADWNVLMPLRLGMRIVQGIDAKQAEMLIAARARGPFASIHDAWRRSGVKPSTLEKLARADAFQCLGLDRRAALWAIKALGEAPLPLIAAADAREGRILPEAAEAPVALLPLSAGREVVEDYRATQLSLRAHPVAFLRDRLDQQRITPCGKLVEERGGVFALKDGARIHVAGIILVRQKPGSAKSVFITLEDETGIANAIVWQDRFRTYRRIIMSATMISVRGRVQREGLVVHIIAEEVIDCTPLLRQVGNADLPRLTAPSDGARNGGQDPRHRKHWNPPPSHYASLAGPYDDGPVIAVKSRDFH
ncbi:error-prone DNA polymerase [Sphingomonas psychrotolerans]|uniref:Error-prone DNA polymerase n=1 Tax=Sphingomonas psychrotolerans TaxID=1327635 RepID=A0ABU3N724_9SPHN|nr:error-prone DNA polymerase [Sphingomonas psychrotolerans]MDT8760061.1 error-prone DNA polymerase [Sphingomonas psychrotolerans]